MVERAIGVHQDLRALAANLFKLRRKPLQTTGGAAQAEADCGANLMDRSHFSTALGSR